MPCQHPACMLFGTDTPQSDNPARCRGCGQDMSTSGTALLSHNAGPPVNCSIVDMQSGPVDDTDMGATQDMANLQLNQDQQGVVGGPPGLSAVCSTSPGISSSTVTLAGSLLKTFIEEEILNHFDLVQASSADGTMAQSVEVVYPQNWEQLRSLLSKLAYDSETQDPWRRLGLAMLDGPEPTAIIIGVRERSALLLSGLAEQAGWATTDTQRAVEFMQKVSEAARHCEEELPYVLKERRRLKVGKLPLFKELGEFALRLVDQSRPQPDELLLTQWSNISQQARISAQSVADSRGIATLAEKGDEKLWDWCCGKSVVLWAPQDTNALTRCLAAFLRRTPGRRPFSVRMLAPIDLLPGMSTVEGVTDLWWHPLLGDKWAPLVREIIFTTMPLEMITSAPTGPRVRVSGLAVFHLRCEGPRTPPRLLNPHAPLLQLPVVPAIKLDVQALDLPKVIALLQAPPYVDLLIRHPRRSVLSTKEVPRVLVDIIIPASYTDLYTHMLFSQLQRQGLPNDAFWCHHSIFANGDAKILEVGSANNAHLFWELCSELVAVSRTKILVISDASAEIWTSVMDRAMQEDTSETHFKLKWKPSRNGGRTIATPTATTAALAASRRQGNCVASSRDFFTDVAIQGEVGREDGEVMRLLMTHLVRATGLDIKETDYSRDPKSGEFYHLASKDPISPPGRLRLYLRDQDEVRKVYAALHNQTVQVGQDYVAITVSNDLVEGARVPGNGRQGRV